MSTYSSVQLNGMPLSQRQKIQMFLQGVCSNPLGLLGLILVVGIVLVAIFADFLVPYDPLEMNIMSRLQSPSWDHWLGTDQLGRDVLSRVMVGSQVALSVALTATFLAAAIGLLLGLIAGYGPEWLDRILLTLFDSVRAFPTVMFALAVVTLTGPSLNSVILIVVITSIPTYGRIIRTQTQALRSAEFIMAEKAMGSSFPRVVFKHILPNVIGPLLIIVSMDIPVVITLEAGLSFLGLGVRPPTPSWGSILNDGFSLIRNTPWLVIAGGIPLILTTLGFTFLGESLRDQLDPKLRKGL